MRVTVAQFYTIPCLPWLAHPVQSPFESLDCFVQPPLFDGVIDPCVYRYSIRRHSKTSHEVLCFLCGSTARSRPIFCSCAKEKVEAAHGGRNERVLLTFFLSNKRCFTDIIHLSYTAPSVAFHTNRLSKMQLFGDDGGDPADKTIPSFRNCFLPHGRETAPNLQILHTIRSAYATAWNFEEGRKKP